MQFEYNYIESLLTSLKNHNKTLLRLQIVKHEYQIKVMS